VSPRIFIYCLIICLDFVSVTFAETWQTMTIGNGLSIGFNTHGQISTIINGSSDFNSEESIYPISLRPFGMVSDTNMSNLLKNGDFENDIGNGWYLKIKEGNLILERAAQESFSGEYSLRITGKGYAVVESEEFSVTPLVAYFSRSFWKIPGKGWLQWQQGGGMPESAMGVYRSHLDGWSSIKPVNGVYIQWLNERGEKLFKRPSLITPLFRSAVNWTLLQREIQAPLEAKKAKIVLYVHLNNETVLVDNLFFSKSPVKKIEQMVLKSQAILPDERFLQRFHLDDFNIDLIYKKEKGMIFLQGEVKSLVATDKAFDLTFSLPIHGSSLSFLYDLNKLQQIEKGLYENTISALTQGWLPVSLYPFIGIIVDGQGFALASPPNVPQFVRFYFDSENNTLNASFHLGTSVEVDGGDNKARFSLAILNFNPKWKLRSLLKRYAEIYPQAFNSKFDFSSYSGLKEWHYCRAANFDEARSIELMKNLKQNSSFISVYLPVSSQLPVIPSSKEPPSYDQVESALLSLVTGSWNESPQAQLCKQDFYDPNIGELATAYQKSRLLDGFGTPILRVLSIPPWNSDYWCAGWIENLDPDIEQGYGRWLLSRVVEPVLSEGIEINAFRLDNFSKFSAIDFRKEAIRFADYPLSYDPNTYKPGSPTIFAEFEFLKKVKDIAFRRYGQDIGFGANNFGLGPSNFWYLLDYFGGEGSIDANGTGSNWNEDILLYRRAMAYGRPMFFSNFSDTMTVNATKRFLALALHYGIRIGINRFKQDKWPEEVISMIDKTNNLIENYFLLGWKPVTGISSNNDPIGIERFGDSIAKGIYFTFYNYTATPMDFEVFVEPDVLNLTKGEYLLKEMASDMLKCSNGEVKRINVLELSKIPFFLTHL